MQELIALWLPILVASVVAFLASWVVWMFLPYHQSEWKKLPNEGSLMDMLRGAGLERGRYCFPGVESSKEWKDPEFKKRFEAGPHGVLDYWGDKRRSMPVCLMFTFLFFVVVNIFVAYIATAALDPGAAYLEVFRIAGTAAFMAFALGGIPNDIWFGRAPKHIAYCVLDGLIYALLVAGIFGWMWPGLPEAAVIPGV